MVDVVPRERSPLYGMAHPSRETIVRVEDEYTLTLVVLEFLRRGWIRPDQRYKALSKTGNGWLYPAIVCSGAHYENHDDTAGWSMAYTRHNIEAANFLEKGFPGNLLFF